jgi:hypothetical protein
VTTTEERRKAVPMKVRPKAEQVRIAYSTEPARTSVATDSDGKVFALIGPFDSHLDKPELQAAIEMLLRGWNYIKD